LIKKIYTILLFVTLTTLYSKDKIIIENEKVKVNLGKKLEYYVDRDGTYEVNDFINKSDIPFIKSEDENLNFGFSRDTHWVRFDVQNVYNNELDILLEYLHPHMDFINVYIVRDGIVLKEITGGDQYPYGHREIDYQNIVYNIKLPKSSETTFYIRFKTQGSMQIPLKLWDKISFAEKVNKEQFFLGLYFGVLIGLLAYNTFLCFFLRDLNYVFYVIYLFIIIILQLEINRLDVEYLWPNSIYFSNITFPMLYNLGFVFAAIFSVNFLQTKKYVPLFDKIIKIFIGIGIVGFLLTIFVSYNAGFFPVLYILAIFEPILLFIAGIVSWKRGNKVARHYTIAWSALIISSLIFNLRNITLLPSVFFTDYALYFGTVIEAIFLSVALADRINMIKAKIITVQEKFTKELEAKVLDRTRELEISNKKLSELSIKDGLTNLYNRRFFDQALEREWNRLMRTGSPLSIIILDIDYFKLYNDNYGHQAGDECIKELAESINSSINRSSDVAARYGGEEFIIILPESGMEGALKVSEKLQDNLSKKRIEHKHSKVSDYVTVSIGISTIIPSLNLTPQLIVKQSDEALYRSKNAGRNKISVY